MMKDVRWKIICITLLVILILSSVYLIKRIEKVENEPNVLKGEGEDRAGVLSEDNIYDLGGHIAAYLMNMTVLGYEGEWLVINDFEKENCVYLPNEFSKILKIEIEDLSSIHLKGAALMLPETVWEETIVHEENTYVIAFERIGLAYYTGSDLYGKYADYQLIVKDKDGNVVSSQILMGYPIALEEVYWLKNISGDDFPDLILCSSYVEGHAGGFTEFNFFIWNNEKLVYESKPLPWNKSMSRPFWNAELSSIIFAYIDDKVNMKMFTFRDGEWQLNGELAEENEIEKENGDIEVELGECFYTDDQIVKNDIRITMPEENMPWNDGNSIWCVDNVQSEWLFPSYGDWNTVEGELDGGQSYGSMYGKISKEMLREN